MIYFDANHVVQNKHIGLSIKISILILLYVRLTKKLQYIGMIAQEKNQGRNVHKMLEVFSVTVIVM